MNSNVFGQDWTSYCGVIESSESSITLKFDFRGKISVRDTSIEGRVCQIIKSDMPSLRKPGEPWLPLLGVKIIIPINSYPTVQITKDNSASLQNVFVLPYPKNSSSAGKDLISRLDYSVYSKNSVFPSSPVQLEQIETFRYSNLLPISVSPVQYNPVTKQLTLHEELTVKIAFNSSKDAVNSANTSISQDPFTKQILSGVVLNPEMLNTFIHIAPETGRSKPSEDYWYNPQKFYAKLYLGDTGIYRIKYSDLINAGANLGSTTLTGKIQIYGNGKQIPIVVNDKDNNGIFDSQDYVQFIGYPAPASDFCTQNIYNTTNVYWLTTDGNAASSLRYKELDGSQGNSQYTQSYTWRTDFYEKDSVFERLGHAFDERRDFWFWRPVSIQSGSPTVMFAAQFTPPKDLLPDSPFVKLRVKLHGMTSYYCGYDHHAIIKINNKNVGEASWNGQEEYLFETKFFATPDSIPIYTSNNYITVTVDGNNCKPENGDEIRVNWFDLSYLSRQRSVNVPYFIRPLPYLSGSVKFEVSNWLSDSIRIYSPESAKMFTRVSSYNDAAKTIFFHDNTNDSASYIIAYTDTYRSVDSIRINQNSDLRNQGNGADYLIIAHRKFAGTANKLKQLRSSDFPDKSISNPRISVVFVDDIYNEFSNGLLNPNAIRDFLKYTFYNWSAPAPAYVVLIGDMSSDYRHIFPSSRVNYIPSLNIMSYLYGIAANDNGFVCVTSSSVHPDMCIGRISIETEEEGNIILNKLQNYPLDKSKSWRNNALMYASGENYSDEAVFGFNDSTLSLRSRYLNPNGFTSKVIFNFPNKPEHQEFKGSTSEMRNGIDNGGLLLNFYGHGGGFQWDRIFMDSDIYKLNNPSRLPLVLSVTCYTAHFDNYDIFGEQFLKVPDKGCIGFFGSSGLTNWEPGTIINNFIFEEIFNKKNYITGRAFMEAKLRTPAGSLYGNQIALLTYLGDPVTKLAGSSLPDFTIQNSDMTFSSESPYLGDTLAVTIVTRNSGIVTSDSVTIDFFAEKNDSTLKIYSVRKPVFPFSDTTTCRWKASIEGQIKFTVRINYSNRIAEEDTNDNYAQRTISINNLNSPQIVQPLNGAKIAGPAVVFKFADFTSSSGKKLKYLIQIDTSKSFLLPFLSSPLLSGSNGIIKWTSPDLNNGIYFYRARIIDDTVSGVWTQPMTFVVAGSAINGQEFSSSSLEILGMVNVAYSTAEHALVFRKDSLTKIGKVLIPAAGPALRWNSFSYNFASSNISGNCQLILEGNYTGTSRWDTLLKTNSTVNDLSGFSARTYPFLRATLILYDSSQSFQTTVSVGSIKTLYECRNELLISREQLKTEKDTIIVGSALSANFRIYNAGPGIADSITYGYLLGEIMILPMHGYENYKRIPPDSSIEYNVPLQTQNLPANKLYSFMPRIISPLPDMYPFNNEGQKDFYIAGDTSRPELYVSADGQQLFTGSSVSPNPDLSIEITDNSPILIQPSSVVIYLDNNLLAFPNDSIRFDYFSTPKNGIRISLRPKLKPGQHLLEIQAKDGSNNYLVSDTSFIRFKFTVFKDNEIYHLLNYPNPFSNGTYFTFHVHAKEKPGRAKIKIFTVAGRMIKEIEVPPSEIRLDINKIFWDGRDNDGNSIANGTYIYKLIIEFADGTKTRVQKIVKMN